LRVIGDRIAIIIVAIGTDRPSIVLAGLYEVQFVPAARAVFETPQAALAVELEAINVALAIGPYLVRWAPLVGERIARCRAAVEVEADHRAERVAEILRRIALHPLTTSN